MGEQGEWESGGHSERQCLSSQIASFTKNQWERRKMEACSLFSGPTFLIEAGRTHVCSYGTKLRVTTGVRVEKPGQGAALVFPRPRCLCGQIR